MKKTLHIFTIICFFIPDITTNYKKHLSRQDREALKLFNSCLKQYNLALDKVQSDSKKLNDLQSLGPVRSQRLAQAINNG